MNLFKATVPPRRGDLLPFISFLNSKYLDNNWIDMEKLPGEHGEYYLSNDSTHRLLFDLDTLQIKSELQYDDDLGDMCTTGVSHSKYLANGDQISICDYMGLTTGTKIVVWTLNEKKQRSKIAEIKTDKLTYLHSFALTENYAVLFESPFHIDLASLIMGYNFDTSLKSDPEAHSKVHAVGLADGKVQTMQLDQWAVVMHFGNSFEKDGKIHIDAPIFENSNKNPFNLLSYSELVEENLPHRQYGSKYKRFTIDLASSRVSDEVLLDQVNGNLDVPRMNPKFENSARSCLTYLIKYFAPTTLDDNYGVPIVKYDSCEKRQVASWGESGLAAQEVQFVPNPDGVDEDDGVLLSMGYNFSAKQTNFYVIDAKNMTTLQEFAFPFRLPMQVHSSFWPGYEYKGPN